MKDYSTLHLEMNSYLLLFCMLICMQFLPLNSLEKFLSEVVQKICCSFYCFIDTKVLNGLIDYCSTSSEQYFCYFQV